MQKPPASSCYSKNCTPGSEWSSGCGVVLGADARLFLWRRVVMGRSRELALTFEASERIVSSAEATGGREQFSPLAHTPQPPTTPGRVKVALREDVGPGSNRLEAERMLRWPGGCCRRFLPRQTVPGLWRTDAATRLSRPSFKGPPEAGAALPRQELGRSCPPEAGAARLPQQQPPAGRQAILMVKNVSLRV